MKKLPIGIQTFSEFKKENCIYVDKTKIIYDIILAGKYYFLARPRRFGKSLLVSTFAEIFSGNKILFAGLAIEALPYEWKKHPVIIISFSDIPYSSPEVLERGIKLYLERIAHSYNIILNHTLLPGRMLQELVMELAKKESVVLLVDEYDYPILQHVHEPVIARQMREVLKSFYAVIKGLDPYLKFVFLTGVSKFSKTSIFSGLNNLNDISLDARFNTLLGYTKQEIETYFEDYLHNIAHHKESSVLELLQKITVWYDGYSFSRDKNAVKLYNPFSVLLYLDKSEFSNYWFETGTPTFLINLLQSKNYPLQSLEGVKATEEDLGQFEVDDIELKTLMFQTGYLTIKDYNEKSGNYILGYPNKETVDSLSMLVMRSMAGIARSDLKDIVALLFEVFENNDFVNLFTILTQLFAAVPYTIHIGEEKYYQTIFYLVLKLLGADIVVEQPTNVGRIDAILHTKDSCFVIEFKINSPVAKAIEQIEAKQYYQPYLLLGKKIILLGIAFDTGLKNISEIEHKELKDIA